MKPAGFVSERPDCASVELRVSQLDPAFAISDPRAMRFPALETDMPR